MEVSRRPAPRAVAPGPGGHGSSSAPTDRATARHGATCLAGNPSGRPESPDPATMGSTSCRSTRTRTSAAAVRQVRPPSRDHAAASGPAGSTPTPGMWACSAPRPSWGAPVTPAPGSAPPRPHVWRSRSGAPPTARRTPRTCCTATPRPTSRRPERARRDVVLDPLPQWGRWQQPVPHGDESPQHLCSAHAPTMDSGALPGSSHGTHVACAHSRPTPSAGNRAGHPRHDLAAHQPPGLRPRHRLGPPPPRGAVPTPPRAGRRPPRPVPPDARA
jgi:hypothetical protein